MGLSRIDEARNHAGLLVQMLAAFPTVILVAMGTASGNFDLKGFFGSIDSLWDYLFILGLVAVPLVGFFVGFCVKRGHRWSYVLTGILGVGSFFLFFPIGAFLGCAVLFLIGRVCLYEFR